MKFRELQPALSPNTLSALDEDFQFSSMTPVQAATIPLFLNHKDVLVEATTGSGKTLAFAIPILEIVKKAIDQSSLTLGMYDVAAMVLAPTRELAFQIHEVMQVLCRRHSEVNCVLFVGGTALKDATASYQQSGGQIVIGTPGRVLDMIRSRNNFNNNSSYSSNVGVLNLKKLEVMVLDEADTLLDMGFKEAINEILSFIPKQRRTGLFSATQTKEVKELARAGLRNPVSVSVRAQHTVKPTPQQLQLQPQQQQQQQQQISDSLKVQQSTPSTLDNTFVVVGHDARPQELVNFILRHRDAKIIVFCATCACVDFYSTALSKLAKSGKIFPPKYEIVGFHGKMVPKKRTGLYRKFSQLSTGGVMFSTDVAARGIDIPDVDWIVQMTAPKDPAFFVHRVGRTARAGKVGGALLYLSVEELPYVELLRGRGVPLREQKATTNTTSTTSSTTTTTATTDATGATGASTADKDYDNKEDDEEDSDDDDNEDDEADSDDDDDDNNDDDNAGDCRNSKDDKHHPAHAIYPVLEHMKQLAMTDRAVLEAGSTAFMSFLRAYKEHLCSYIFRAEELDIGAVARAYALLRLPKIPETRERKGAKPIIFEPTYIDTSTIPYQHKEREAARKRRLELLIAAQKEEQAQMDAGLIPSGMSVLSRKSGRAWIAPEQFAEMEEPKRNRRKKQGVHNKIMDEWDDLAVEEMAYRKFKKGKISKEEYEACLTSDLQIDIDPCSGAPIVAGAGAAGGGKSNDDSSDDSDACNSDNDNSGSDDKSNSGNRTSNKLSKTVAFGVDHESDENDNSDSSEASQQQQQNSVGNWSSKFNINFNQRHGGGGSIRQQQQRIFGSKKKRYSFASSSDSNYRVARNKSNSTTNNSSSNGGGSSGNNRSGNKIDYRNKRKRR